MILCFYKLQTIIYSRSLYKFTIFNFYKFQYCLQMNAVSTLSWRQGFLEKMLDFDFKISKACGLKGVKDIDLLYIRNML